MPQLCELLGVQINWRKFKDNKLELCLRGNLAQYTLERMRRLLASGGREGGYNTFQTDNTPSQRWHLTKILQFVV